MLKIVVVVLTLFGASFCLPGHSLDTRIIGGLETTIKEHPYQLALYFHKNYICGAVLIGHNWAITTAHCVDSWQATGLKIRAGSTSVDEGGQVILIRRAYLNPNYNRRTLDYNYALLELRGTVAVRDAQPIRLASASRHIVPGEIATITGWGQTTVDSDYPKHLQFAVMPIVSHAFCEESYPGYIITETMFCGGTVGVEGPDASHGDRGGPVVINGQLVGLISWAINHGSPLRPDVYASIPAVRDWIEEITGI